MRYWQRYENRGRGGGTNMRRWFAEANILRRTLAFIRGRDLSRTVWARFTHESRSFRRCLHGTSQLRDEESANVDGGPGVIKKSQDDKRLRCQRPNVVIQRNPPGERAWVGDAWLLKEADGSNAREGSHAMLAHERFAEPWLITAVMQLLRVSYEITMSGWRSVSQTVSAASISPCVCDCSTYATFSGMRSWN